MLQAAFNPLEYVHKLEKAGMKKELAEIQAQTQLEIITTLIQDHAVTKQDITDIRKDTTDIRQDIKDVRRDISDLDQKIDRVQSGLNQKIDQVEARLDQKIDNLGKELKQDMLVLRKDLTIRLGVMMSSGMFILIAMMKLFHL